MEDHVIGGFTYATRCFRLTNSMVFIHDLPKESLLIRILYDTVFSGQFNHHGFNIIIQPPVEGILTTMIFLLFGIVDLMQLFVRNVTIIV